jgi:hypothetical protein
MKRVDELLRDTVHEMTMQVAPSTDLARQAMAQGRRIRRRRQLAMVAGAVLVVPAVAAPVMIMDPGREAPPASITSPAPTSTSPPVVATRVITAETRALAGGWTAVAAGGVVLNSWRRGRPGPSRTGRCGPAMSCC